MTYDRRTDPPGKIATRRIKRNEDGSIVFPRVVERKPHPGDVHPIPANIVVPALQVVPIEYIYGLKAVELRPRQNAVGSPWGEYRQSGRTIVIYSVSLAEYILPGVADYMRGSMGRSGATLEDVDGGVRVHWSDLTKMAMWHVQIVLFHELGHHYDYQYRHRKGQVKGRLYKEAFANKQGSRLIRRLHRLMEEHRAKSGNS